MDASWIKRLSKTIALFGYVFLVIAGIGFLVFALMYCVGTNQKFWQTSPYEYPNSVWVSEDPKIVLRLGADPTASSGPEAYVTVDGEPIPVYFIMGISTSDVSMYKELRRDSKGAYFHYDDLLMRGTKAHCTKEKATFKVKKDILFGGKYEGQRITLYRQWDEENSESPPE